MSKFIEIKDTYGKVIFSSDKFDTIKQAVEHCLSNGISLIRADLSGLDLSGLDFSRANLFRADFTGANFTDADCTDANFSRANFSRADCTDANFSRANLFRADFTGANFTDADFTGADFTGANFTDANFSRADFTGVDLCDCIGNGKEIVTFKTEFYICNFTKDFLSIGCRTHTYEEWFNFSDDVISEMDTKALEFWNKYKEILKELKTKYGF